MNNSKFAIEGAALKNEMVNRQPFLQEREGELIAILDAIRTVQGSKAWSTLKTEVFDGLVERLTKDLQTEAKKETPDGLKLNRLAGQLKWAERYSDLSKLELEFRLELTNIRTQLYGKTEKTG